MIVVDLHFTVHIALAIGVIAFSSTPAGDGVDAVRP